MLALSFGGPGKNPRPNVPFGTGGELARPDEYPFGRGTKARPDDRIGRV